MCDTAVLFDFRFADIFAKHMKVYLLVLYSLSFGAFIWIALMFIQVAPFQTGNPTPIIKPLNRSWQFI